MRKIRPQSLVHRGNVVASGFFFSTELLPVAVAQQRVIELWVPGATVFRLSTGIVLRLPIPVRINCATAPGVPLVHQGTVLVSAPLSAKELDALFPPENAVLLIAEGEVIVETLSPDRGEDPADWLDVSAYRLAPVVSLGERPAPPRLLAEPTPFDARSQFTGIPKADPQRQMVLDALQGKGAPTKESPWKGSDRESPTRLSVLCYPFPASKNSYQWGGAVDRVREAGQWAAISVGEWVEQTEPAKASRRNDLVWPLGQMPCNGFSPTCW